MTTQQQAKRLVINIQYKLREHRHGWGDMGTCKGLANLMVDEIISALKTTTGHIEMRDIDANEVDRDINYWKEVKRQIKML